MGPLMKPEGNRSMSTTRFTADHEWLRLEHDGTVTVGITDYAQNQLGDVVFVELPEVGQRLRAGDEAAVIESVKAAGGISLPLAGTVVEINPALSDLPGLVNSAPQGEGWFFRLRLDAPDQFSGLMDETAYAALT